MVAVKRLTTRAEWRDFYPVVRDFWPVGSEAEYLATLATMTEDGYRPFGLSEDCPLAFAGVYRLHASWYGRFVWLLDFVTRPDRRGEGIGSMLLEEIEDWAKQQGCETVVLGSGKGRTGAHEFYEDRGYEMTEYWFEKSLR